MTVNPAYRREKFECPHCCVTAQQSWINSSLVSFVAMKILRQSYYDYRASIYSNQQEAISSFIEKIDPIFGKALRGYIPEELSISMCAACARPTIWIEKAIVFPKRAAIDPPNKDMNEEIRQLYIEASNIVYESPKGAAALLRLALQLLLKQLGKPGNNINNDIKELVADGLSPKLQKALDLLRVVGNNAVHPGQIDLNDGRDIANKLFHLLNFIADEMISKPKELELLYVDIVPDETKKHINDRDGK